MELRQLEYFLAIAKYGNIAEASREMHVSSPALSTTLKDLERELGFDLFDRNGRRLAINENGKYFARRARSMFAILNDAQQTVRENLSERQRTVNCRVDVPLGRIGKNLFRGFHGQHPETVLRMGFADSALVGKESSAIDLEIIGSMIELEPNERTAKIGYERFVAVLPANHRLASRESLTLTDLENEHFLLGEPGAMRTVVEAMFVEAGFVPKVIAEMQLYCETLQLVRAGMGCCIAAEYTWFQDSEPELSIKPLKGTAQGRYLFARVPQDREPSKATWDLLEYIRANSHELMPKPAL